MSPSSIERKRAMEEESYYSKRGICSSTRFVEGKRTTIVGGLNGRIDALKISNNNGPSEAAAATPECGTENIPLGMINPNTCICQPPWANKHCLATHVPDNIPSSDRHDDGLTRMEEEGGRSGGILVSKLEENESGRSESDDKSDDAAWPINVPPPCYISVSKLYLTPPPPRFYIPVSRFFTPPPRPSDTPTSIYPNGNFTNYNPCSVTYLPFEEGKRDIVVPISFKHGPLMNPSEYKES